MNTQTKQNLKNAAKTGGRWTLQGIKLAGKGALTATELTTKGIANVAESYKSRKILAGAGTLAAGVAVAPATITIAALDYMIKNCLLDENCSPVTALKDTFRATNSVLKGVLDVAAPVVGVVAKETSELAKKGKEVLDR